MRSRLVALLREERGQSLVLFIVSFMALTSILALLVNLGSWLQSKERLRIVADATALEAAQGDHDTFAQISFEAPNAAQARAQGNWAGSALTQYQFLGGLRTPTKSSLDILIETQHDVGYLLEGILDYLGIPLDPLTFSSQARVRIASPEGLPQVAPIALKCPTPCTAPFPGWTGSPFTNDRDWPLDPADTSPTSPDAVSFNYEPAHPPDQTSFLPLRAFPGATLADVQSILQSCDARVPTNPCGMDVSNTPTAWDIFPPDPDPIVAADELRAALQTIGDWPHLVPVYESDPVGGQITIIGFAAFDFTVDTGPPGRGGPVIITGTFHKMFFDNGQLFNTGHDPEDGAYDFGVRSIAYTGPRDVP